MPWSFRLASSIVAAAMVATYLFLWHIGLKVFFWEDLLRIAALGVGAGLLLNLLSGWSYAPALIIFAPLLAPHLLSSLTGLTCFTEWVPPRFREVHLEDCWRRQLFIFQFIGTFGCGVLGCTLVTRLSRKRPSPLLNTDAGDTAARAD